MQSHSNTGPEFAPEIHMERKHYPWLLALAFVAVGFVLFGSAGRDDCYISFWPAHTLARYGEIVNYNGARVEQSSSLLHVLVLAISSLVTGLEPHDLGRPISILFGALTVVGACRLGGLGAGAITAVSLPLVYWSFGGLETSIYAFLLVLLCLKNWWTVPMLVMVRPEAQFVLCLAFCVAWFWSRERLYGHLIVTTIASAAVMMAWRMFYFGQPFPQPVMAKVGGIQFSEGFGYLMLGWPLVLMALALPFAKDRKLETALAFSVLAFVLSSGGDWMEGARFLAPIAPLAAVGVAGWKRVRYPSFAVASAWLLSFVWIGSTGTPIWEPRPEGNYWESTNKVHRRDVPVARAMIGIARKEASPVVLSGQMGFVAYKTALALFPNVTIYDLAGLADDSLKELSKRKTRTGYRVSYKDAINAKRPSIIFDLKDRREELAGLGYETVFWQSGMIAKDLAKDQFIALRIGDNMPLAHTVADKMNALPRTQSD